MFYKGYYFVVLEFYGVWVFFSGFLILGNFFVYFGVEKEFIGFLLYLRGESNWK